MFLKYIEIQGFKSFPDKTKIKFEPGVTAIVGPNGSGKSNISDAIRWVLGEQSTKSLRGGKMEDVIFGGSQLRGAMGFAQVTLVLDNADGRFAEMGDEIAVGRRYYRSGDSEYLLNGATVRLRDVRETFMDTGLSRDGYSIVGQGKITEIVSSKPEDRREIFEEASGIAKYRFRKNEAQRKLDAAEDNLSRLRDILDELEGRIGPLKKQSEAAKVFLDLSAERKNLEITLYCDTIERSKNNLKQQDEKIEIARQDYARMEEQIRAIDDEIEKSYENNREMIARIDMLNNEIIETGDQIALIESASAVVQNDIEHGVQQIETLKKDRELAVAAGGGIGAEIGQKREQVVLDEAELAALDAQVTQLTERLAALALEGEQSDKRLSEINKKLTELSGEATDIKVAGVSAKTTAESLVTRIESLGEGLPVLEAALKTARAEKTEMDEALNEAQKEIASCENQRSGYEQKRQSRVQKLEQAEAQLNKKSAEIAELENRVRMLEEMEKSMEGFAPSVKRIVETARGGKLRGVTGTVASLIKIQGGCEVAIETALGAAMQNIVVADEQAAKDAIAYLKENRAGRATFLPLDTIKPSRFDGESALSMHGVVGLASRLVSCASKYDDVISYLLGRIIIAEDINAAQSVAKSLKYRFRVVTLDGQVINAGGSYTGGFLAKSAGVFSRKNEIDRLAAKKADAESALVGLRAERDKARTELTEIEAQITVLSSELVNLGGDKIRIETEQKRLANEYDYAKNALETAQNELEGSQELLEMLAEEVAESDKRLGEIAEEIRQLEEGQNDASLTGDAFNKKRTELADALSERKVARMEKQKDLERLVALIDQLSERGESESSRTDEIDKAIAAIEQLNDGRRADLELKQLQVEQLRAKIDESKQEIAAGAEQRTQYEKDATAARERSNALVRDREEIGREMSRLEERKVALNSEYESATAKLWEEYELTVNEAGQFCVPYTNISALRSEVASVRGKIRALGNVNVAAIEEYAEVSERYEFLTAQVADVTKSRSELIAMIDQLMGEMKTIFTKNFELINNNFRKVFIELFGGGSANLSLTDENDVLESGIEMNVQPPGKLIKNLSALSGGEQSLVAIALYFSIMAVNPAPFCVLDEIDSALDDANVVRYATYLNRFTDTTQLITITHRRGTMEAADVLYGVTMQEEGVSKMLKLTKDEAVLVAHE